ncbi:MAG: glycosyltransferase family 2 protein [Clostridia bacterium]|nr:glycosyltransferase family 2 protein [Clostridia bacterium]
MPKISVIVPVYKVEQYLCRCIDSILGQTFSDFELILVDDGSPDNCGKICDEYAAKDERIHVIHQENGGLSAARNTGIDWAFDNSDSEWLAFIDSDDWVHKEYLEALLAAAEITKLPVSVVSFKRVRDEIDSDELSFVPTLIEIHNTEEFFCKRNVEATVAWGKIYRKELFRNLRYPVGKIHEDEFLTYKIIFQCPQIAYLPLTMYWYYQNPNGIMNSLNVKEMRYSSEAYEEQAVFFHEKKMVGLRDTALRRMLDSTKKAIKRAEIERDNSVTKRMKTELKRRIKWIKNELNIPLYAHEYMYEAVMPRRAALSRKWRHFKMRVRSILIH